MLPEGDVDTEPRKRRSDEEANMGAKRRRISAGDASEAPLSTKSQDPHEERKRSRRLFGAMLGTLAQGPTSAASKRRAEIEQKQRAKLRAAADGPQSPRDQSGDGSAVSVSAWRSGVLI